MDKLAVFIAFLNRYCVAYQTKYVMVATSQVSVQMLSKDTTITIQYLIPSANAEPTISVGQYWFNSFTIRKCVSNVPSVQLQHTYTDITDFTAEFGFDVQLVSESIDVGPNAPIPTPVTIPGKGTFQVSNGQTPVDFLPGTDGFGLVCDSNSNIGLRYVPIVTLSGTEILSNKRLISPIIEGGLSGSALLNDDSMAAESTVCVPSQRSVKHYVDNKVALATTLMCFKLNVVKTSDGLFAQIDGDPKFKKNTATLSSNLSSSLVAGTSSVVGNVTFELDSNSFSIGVSATGLVLSAILSVSLYSANIGKAITPRVDVSGSQLQFWFTDLNGVPVSLAGIPNNSIIETLVTFS